MNGYLRITACVAIGMFGVACSSGSSGPLSGLNPAAPAATAASDGHGLVLHAVVGDGTGIVNVTTNARTGDFVVNTEDAVQVRGVAPDTLLYVRVAVDAGLGGQQADGICQRANLGQFGPIALSPGGLPATIETSPGGTGTVHIVGGFTSPFVSNGAQMDIAFRVVDAIPPAVPTIDLRTDCFTIEIR